MLGEFSATCGEERIRQFRTHKTAALFAYLAYHPCRPHSREALCEILWPQESRDSAGASLSTALWWLRRELSVLLPTQIHPLATDRNSITLSLDWDASDVARFENTLSIGGREAGVSPTECLRNACALYQGELLPGHFEEWVQIERHRLAARHFQASRELIHTLERAGALREALAEAIRLVGLDPLQEVSHYELIRIYLAAGQPVAAWTTYRDLERMLDQEYRSQPSPATKALLAGTAVGSSASLPAGSMSTVALEAPLQPPGGAIAVDSPHYVVRDSDRRLMEALDRQASIILVKGGNQLGKSSLLARGLSHARASGARVLLTDFEALSREELETAGSLYLSVANGLALQLDPDSVPRTEWDEGRSPGANFERYLRREVLASRAEPFVWALDGVDRLFEHPYGTEVFRLLRSWHNARALDPEGPWARLTMIIAYATEVNRFIRDPNQSPFNVGTHLVLEAFTPTQVEELNRQLLYPLRGARELRCFMELVGGHPYLVHQGLHHLRMTRGSLDQLVEQADRDDGPFGRHLRRQFAVLASDQSLLESLRGLIGRDRLLSPEDFYRLRAAGIVTGDNEQSARLHCTLYERYFARHLGVSIPNPPSIRKLK